MERFLVAIPIEDHFFAGARAQLAAAGMAEADGWSAHVRVQMAKRLAVAVEKTGQQAKQHRSKHPERLADPPTSPKNERSWLDLESSRGSLGGTARRFEAQSISKSRRTDSPQTL